MSNAVVGMTWYCTCFMRLSACRSTIHVLRSCQRMVHVSYSCQCFVGLCFSHSLCDATSSC